MGVRGQHSLLQLSLALPLPRTVGEFTLPVEKFVKRHMFDETSHMLHAQGLFSTNF